MTVAHWPITGPYPRDIEIELTCDAVPCQSDLFARSTHRFVAKPGEDVVKIASAAGWSLGNPVRCPACRR